MSEEYNKYLKEHKENVAKGYYWLVKNFPDMSYSISEVQICLRHDESKLDDEEYYAYDEYFYGKNPSFYVKQEFNKAWLRHIHKNPHHWQYWILVNDDPNEGEILLDIPQNYIIEMICDWWSFCWKDGNLFGIFDWYNEHKQWMKLSDNTRRQVEFILAQINTKLKENGGM